MAASAEMWTVVGGGAKGGLAVREGSELAAPELCDRLCTGSIVKALEVEEGRIRYELVRGEGPASGWVSTRFKGKDLLLPAADRDVEEASTAEGSSSEEAERLSPEEQLLLAYSARFGAQVEEDEVIGIDPEGLNWCAPVGAEKLQERPHHEVRAELTRMLQATSAKKESEAQSLLRRLNEEEASRKRQDREQKLKLSAEYGIGWKVENIPINMAASALEREAAPSFMCALVLDEDSGSIRIAPTVEPAAAVNLEYLSTALRVRREDGREPFFSLDPVDGTDTASMQRKRFEPSWLAETSLGEVMFQADYLLKALSMGEHQQPVVGMKSCFDFLDGREKGMDWNAREWFVVRRVDLLVSGDRALVPLVRMGVEAREQVAGESGMEDAHTTRPDHPLARYAEVFTQNFDLIAERLSVVNQLREVAKASVLAKYLMDSGIELDESWFNLATRFEGPAVTEVPQLWNERYHGKVLMQDGPVAEDALRPRMRGVYGGVQFGLEKFTVGARAASAAVQFARVGARGPMPRVSAALSMATSVTGGLRTPAMRAAVSMRAGGVPRGVQFGLEKFTVGARAASTSVQFARVGARGPMPRVSAALSMATSVTGGLRTPAMRAAVSMRAGGVPRGVQFGLEKFTVGARAAAASVQFARVGARGPMPRVSAALSMATSVTGGLRTPAMRAAVSMRAGGVPRGVDLNLDGVVLGEAVQTDEMILSCAGSAAPMGSSFWWMIDNPDEGILGDKDAELLRAVFNPSLSDRREEGDLFVPPQTNRAHAEKLRALVREEASVQEQRKRHFFSSKFEETNAGPLFPFSWQDSFQAENPAATAVELRADFLALAGELAEALEAAAPVFDKSTEEGSRFRIYRLGSLEVRTCQEARSPETVGAVLAARA